jgi:hypothetical protein
VLQDEALPWAALQEAALLQVELLRSRSDLLRRACSNLLCRSSCRSLLRRRSFLRLRLWILLLQEQVPSAPLPQVPLQVELLRSRELRLRNLVLQAEALPSAPLQEIPLLRVELLDDELLRLVWRCSRPTRGLSLKSDTTKRASGSNQKPFFVCVAYGNLDHYVVARRFKERCDHAQRGTQRNLFRRRHWC